MEENKKIYQSYYCGLCRKLKEFCGKKGQALLNYDMTFLVVLLTGLYEPDTQTGEFTCMMHPMKKRQLRENDIQSYAAQMNVLLAYYNLVDDWKDDHNYTKKTIASMFEKDYQRIKINYPRQTNAIEQYMEKLATYEAEKQTNIDLVAGLTGEMLGEIFAWNQHSRNLKQNHRGLTWQLRNLIVFLCSVHKNRLPVFCHHRHVHISLDASQCRSPDPTADPVPLRRSLKDSLNAAFLSSFSLTHFYYHIINCGYFQG